MDPHGNFVPVPDTPGPGQEPAPEPAKADFEVGDQVTLTGRVLEVQSQQGGQTSVKVQLPQDAVWLRAEHLEHVTPPPKAAPPAPQESKPFSPSEKTK